MYRLVSTHKIYVENQAYKVLREELFSAVYNYSASCQINTNKLFCFKLN